MELKQKGSSAAIGAFEQLKVALIWTSAVDLDLMVFYKTKDNRTGGVYSDNYSGGNMGSLNTFPYMQLSGDAGVGATGGDNREDMLISKLENIEELYVVAVNFTDASAGANKVFADYDARVEVTTDRGESHTIKLDSSVPGSVAMLCKFTSNFMGVEIANDSTVMSFENFKGAVPGASSLKLLSKVTLKNKGDAHTIELKQKGAADEIVINLNWNSGGSGSESSTGGIFGRLLGGRKNGGIDLDLGCFYELNGGGKSVIDGLQFSEDGGPRDKITRQGCYTQSPWIWHMGDDRSGSEMDAGEFILINPQGYEELCRLTIYAYIYEGVTAWDQTDGVVTLKVPSNPVIEIEMGQQHSKDNFCAIAGIDFLGKSQIRVTKLLTFHKGHGECDKTYNWGMRWQEGKK